MNRSRMVLVVLLLSACARSPEPGRTVSDQTRGRSPAYTDARIEPSPNRERILEVLRKSGPIDAASSSSHTATEVIDELQVLAREKAPQTQFSKLECFSRGCMASLHVADAQTYFVLGRQLGMKAKESWDGPVIVTGPERQSDQSINTWLVLLNNRGENR